MPPRPRRRRGYIEPLPSGSFRAVERIQRGEIDPHPDEHPPLPLGQAPHGYNIFKHKQDGCEKVVLRP